MPDKKKTGTETESAPAKAPKFSIARLRRDCIKLFGVTTSTYDGATHGETRDFTVEEMREHIKKWQNTPVKPAAKKEGK